MIEPPMVEAVAIPSGPEGRDRATVRGDLPYPLDPILGLGPGPFASMIAEAGAESRSTTTGSCEPEVAGLEVARVEDERSAASGWPARPRSPSVGVGWSEPTGSSRVGPGGTPVAATIVDDAILRRAIFAAYVYGIGLWEDIGRPPPESAGRAQAIHSVRVLA